MNGNTMPFRVAAQKLDDNPDKSELVELKAAIEELNRTNDELAQEIYYQRKTNTSIAERLDEVREDLADQRNFTDEWERRCERLVELIIDERRRQ